MRRFFLLLALFTPVLNAASPRPDHVSAGASIPKPVHATAAMPGKRALLVGVSTYQRGGGRNKDWWDLNTDYDIKLLKEMLIRKFQFEEKDIKILTLPQETTKKAILDAFRAHLINPTQPGDIVFF